MKTKHYKASAHGGFALILVMITILALTALVASFTISMSTEVRLARNADYDEQLEWMGRSGMEYARWAIANKCPEQQNIDALNQFWAGGTSACSNGIAQLSIQELYLGDGRYSDFKIVDMERKWDINLAANPRAPQMPVLQKAMAIVGVNDAALSSTIVDSMLDWCNPNSASSFSGAKDDYYTHLNPPYYCKNGMIDDLSELLLIKGISPDIYWGPNSSKHPVSAYQQHGGGAFGQPTGAHLGFRNKDEPEYEHGLEELFAPLGGKLNVNTATPLTLQLIPGVDESLAERIIQQRDGPDGVAGTDDDAPFQSIPEFLGVLGTSPTGGQSVGGFIDVRSYVFDVQVKAELNGYKNTYHGIISRSPKNPKELSCVKFYWELGD